MSKARVRVAKGRVILEFDAAVRVPIELEAVAKGVLPDRPLSHREQQVLERILRALDHKEIANELNICTRTVKHHASELYKKFLVKNRSELMMLFTSR